jgi:hypothetical protein
MLRGVIHAGLEAFEGISGALMTPDQDDGDDHYGRQQDGQAE